MLTDFLMMLKIYGGLKIAPWIDDELRSELRREVWGWNLWHKSGCFADKSLNCNLRNKITKLNYIKKKELVLIIAKTKCFAFGSRNALPYTTAFSLAIDGISVEQVTKTKLLCVKFDDLLSWFDQVDHIVSMMGKYAEHFLEIVMPSSIMSDFVQSLVLSHMEYCLVIWSSWETSKNLLKLPRTEQPD